MSSVLASPETAASGLGPILWAALLGAVPLLLWWLRRRANALPPAPKDGVWTLSLLRHYNGKNGRPLCLAVCGKVVDCSSSENIKYGEGYGKLWAGCDATHALATLSLNPADANKLDWKLSDLEDSQRTALAGWYKHFTTKYVVVGTLKEYDGWDFTDVFKESKAQTPFGAKRTEEEEEAPAAKAKSAPPSAAAKANEGQVFAKGDKVRLVQIVERADLEGQQGVLEGYNPQKGGFEVRLPTGEVVVATPDHLVKVQIVSLDGDDDSPKRPAAAATPATSSADTKAAAAKAAAAAQGGVVLARGDEVSFVGMDDEGLNGQTGVLQTYNPAKGGFEVQVKAGSGAPRTVVAKPTQLVKAAASTAAAAPKKEEKPSGLALGTRVWIFGCDRPELEGRHGTIKEHDTKKGIYTLLMDKTEKLEQVMSWHVVVEK